MARKASGKNFILRGGFLSLCLAIYLFVPVLMSFYLAGRLDIYGMGLYAGTYSLYMLILIICGISVPRVIAALVSERFRRGCIKDGRAMLRHSFFYCVITGAGLGLLLFFFSGSFAASVVRDYIGDLPLKILGITCIFAALCSYFRGYFMAHGTVSVLGISLLTERIAQSILGLIFFNGFGAYGEKISRLLRTEEYIAGYGIAGLYAGALAGYVITLFFMFVMYIATHGYMRKAFGTDVGRIRENMIIALISYAKRLIPTMGLAFAIYGAPAVYHLIYKLTSIPADDGAGGYLLLNENWGLYFFRYRMLMLIPLSLLLIMSRVPAGMAANEAIISDARKRKALAAEGVKSLLIAVIPVSVIIGLGGGLISGLLYPELDNTVLITLLRIGFLSPVFCAPAIVLHSILWESGRRLKVMIGVIVPFVLSVFLSFVFSASMKLGVRSFVLADLIFALTVMVSAVVFAGGEGFLRKGFAADYIGVLAGTLAMSLAVFVLNLVMARFGDFPLGLVLLVIMAVIGTAVFYVLILVLRGASERVLRNVPGGFVVAFVGKMIGFL